MKPKLTKALSLKCFGSKQAIQDLDKLVDSNFVAVTQEITYNSQYANYEQWIIIYTQENES